MVYWVSERERRAVVARRGGRVSVRLARGIGIEDSDDVEVDVVNVNDPVL